MKHVKQIALGVVLGLTLVSGAQAVAKVNDTTGMSVGSSVRLKEIARVEGVRDNALVGYGIVVGLAGTGDSGRSKATMQSVMNALIQFGIQVSASDINSRNVAAVMITSTLPSFAQQGDKIDINVSSVGDARSLVGGTLLLAPLKGANERVYALAQGQISVGGYKYDLNGNVVQKNHPTVGRITDGATVERSVLTELVDDKGFINIVLQTPDFTTVNRLKKAINVKLENSSAKAIHAGRISVKVPAGEYDLIELLTTLENVTVVPDRLARIVVNERTGTIVSGGDVRINDVTISHGNIKVVISTEFTVSQPYAFGRGTSGATTMVVPETQIKVKEKTAQAIDLRSGTTIGELITALRQIKTSTRDVITILQAIKEAGALRAQLIVQ